MQELGDAADELHEQHAEPHDEVTSPRRSRTNPIASGTSTQIATPLAMYVIGLSVGSQMADRKRDDAIEDAIHALLLRLPPVEGS